MEYNNIDELYEGIKQECQKSMDEITNKYKLIAEDEEKLNQLIKEIMKDTPIERKVYRDYCIVFNENECVDNIRIKVEQKDRPNGADDDDVIREYIWNNYGYRYYEIIEINMLDKVVL